MKWLLGEEDVWSGELEYRLKRAITFDPTVGSRSNFFLIKCKYCIDQKEQGKLAVQAGNQQYKKDIQIQAKGTGSLEQTIVRSTGTDSRERAKRNKIP